MPVGVRPRALTVILMRTLCGRGEEPRAVVVVASRLTLWVSDNACDTAAPKVAVTRTRRSRPASAGLTRWVDPLPTATPSRSQVVARVVPVGAVQVPEVAVSTFPDSATPVTSGAAVLVTTRTSLMSRSLAPTPPATVTGVGADETSLPG